VSRQTRRRSATASMISEADTRAWRDGRFVNVRGFVRLAIAFGCRLFHDGRVMSTVAEPTHLVSVSARLGSRERAILDDLNSSPNGIIRIGSGELRSALSLIDKASGQIYMNQALYLKITSIHQGRTQNENIVAERKKAAQS
jgi:hypothetical protein